MRTNFIIWVVVVSLLLLVLVNAVFAGLFNDHMGLVYRWAVISLLPLSALFGWFFYTGRSKSNKLATACLLLFSLGCLASLYARNFLPPASAYDEFLRIFGYAPIFLLPLQLLTAVFLIRANKPDQYIATSFLAGRGAQVQELVEKAHTLPALDLALETVGDQDEQVKLRLLTLKNTLVKAQQDAGMLLISSDELRSVEARVANTLLEML